MTTEKPCGCVHEICHCPEGANLWRRMESARLFLEFAQATGAEWAWREYQKARAAYEAHFGDEQEAQP